MTKRQKYICEMYALHPGMTMRAVAEELGVSQAYVAKVIYKPEMKEYISKIIKEYWQDSERAAVKNMVELANNGNDSTRFQANKYILDNLGYGAEQKFNIDGGIHIDIDYGE